VVEYYTSDSNKPELADIAGRLSHSKEHEVFMKQVIGLMEQSSGAVRPLTNENIEQFFKRLGGYIMKSFSQQKQ
jgi:hypothetical protein